MIIGIDAMGGDNAPKSILDGIELAFNKGFNQEIFLYGNEDLLKSNFSHQLERLKKLKVIHCSENIEGDDKPVKAIRQKKDSSIVRASNDLKAGKIDAFLSAGNTGALLAAGTLIVGRIKGVKRPALTTAYPTEKGFSILTDVGANADCTEQNIELFAIMGSLYAKKVLDIKNPSIALLNIGTEDTKGSELYIKSHLLLKANSKLNFKGNIESRDLLKGNIDVVVCDGFTGNICLKLMEGTGSSLMNITKKFLLSSFISKIGAVLIKKSLKQMKNDLNPSKFGGAPFLGTSFPVIKAHGSSDEIAIMNAIFYAEKYAKSNLINELKSTLETKKENNQKEL